MTVCSLKESALADVASLKFKGEAGGTQKHYLCADRGTTRCPCHLMAAGQCYTCSMCKTGVCDCGASAGWQGVCPYSEYQQRGGRSIGPAKPVSLEVVERRVYSPDLVVVTLRGGAGFAIQCRQPGAYVMAEAFVGSGDSAAAWKETPDSKGADQSGTATEYVAAERVRGWRTPLSVLAADPAAGTVDFLVRPAGPKTAWLTEPGRKSWLVTGPFCHGLLHGEGLSRTGGALAIVRGTALAPYLCASASLGWTGGTLADEGMSDGSPPDVKLYLDPAGLTEDFLADYLVGQAYVRIDLNDEKTLHRMREKLRAALGQSLSETGREQAAAESGAKLPEGGRGPCEANDLEQTELPRNVMMLVSPYFAKKLTEGLTEREQARLICPNTANLCCGEGICGACAYTDEAGQTVRLCKCHGLVLE